MQASHNLNLSSVSDRCMPRWHSKICKGICLLAMLFISVSAFAANPDPRVVVAQRASMAASRAQSEAVTAEFAAREAGAAALVYEISASNYAKTTSSQAGKAAGYAPTYKGETAAQGAARKDKYDAAVALAVNAAKDAKDKADAASKEAEAANKQAEKAQIAAKAAASFAVEAKALAGNTFGLSNKDIADIRKAAEEADKWAKSADATAKRASQVAQEAQRQSDLAATASGNAQNFVNNIPPYQPPVSPH